MDADLVAKQLSALASGSKRSKTAQLRDIIEPVENAIRAGVRYDAIIETLDTQGLKFTYQTFALTLKRIRRERQNVGESSARNL
ncbi:TPA: hypothetical protein ACUNF5_002743 [Burkholderia orbicola]